MAKKKKSRDNFPESVRRVLWERVGGLCSNPDCGKMTLGPDSSDQNKTLRLGEAAHIHAAAPLGPRYDNQMTPTQRKSAENGIWLCTACAKKIDLDKAKHPADLLKAWKNKSEAQAVQRIGKPIPSHSEALNAFGILTGRAPFDDIGIISGVHAAVRERFECIDPRLHVGVNYIGGVTEFQIAAKKEPVDMSLNFAVTNKAEREELIGKMREAIHYGGKYEFCGMNMSIKGSPLFDLTSNNISVLRIENGDDISCFVEILEDKNGKTLCSVQTEGKFSVGTKGFRIATSAWNGLISFDWKSPLNNGKPLLKCVINFSLKGWIGTKVTELPYWDNLHEFCDLFSKHQVKFTIVGKKLSRPVIMHADMFLKQSEDLLNILKYTQATKIISKFLQNDIRFTLDCKVSDEEINNVFIVADIIKDGQATSFKTKENSFLSSTFKLDEKNINRILALKKETSTMSIAVCDSKPNVVLLMGINVETPPQRRIFHNVVAKFREEERQFKIGDEVTIDFVPSENFSSQIYFDDPANPLDLSAKRALE